MYLCKLPRATKFPLRMEDSRVIEELNYTSFSRKTQFSQKAIWVIETHDDCVKIIKLNVVDLKMERRIRDVK